jgi:DNA (cytosine-5)-methyltransferase 1
MSVVQPTPTSNPTYISLFCGCGGLDEGLEMAGFDCKGAFDNDQLVVETYKRNLKGNVVLHDLSDHSLPIAYNTGEIDVVVSGSPCQGFSTAGLRKLEDPRNQLLLVGGRITQKLKPKVFIAENVMGSFSGFHKKYWEELTTLLKQCGYKVSLNELSGIDFGLAQTRKRLFLIAYLNQSELNFTFERLPAKNLLEAIENVEGINGSNLFNEIQNPKTLELISHIRPGQKLCNVRGSDKCVHTWDIPEVFGKTSSEEKQVLLIVKELRRKIRLRKFGDADPVLPEDIQKYCTFDINQEIESLIKKKYLKKNGDRIDLVHSFNGLYRRLEWNKPSMTVDTRFGNPRFFLHPEKMRGFSVREAARIQGFPDTFTFFGPISKQFKMIGNAVPPPMAFAVASAVKKQLFQT